MTSFIRLIAIIVATTTLACRVDAELIEEPGQQTCPLHVTGLDTPANQVGRLDIEQSGDRIWLLSTRRLSSSARCINVQHPRFSVYRLGACGANTKIAYEEFEAQLTPSRPLVVYVHGNLIDSGNAVSRGMTIYRSIRNYRTDDAVDWLIWSWPSDKDVFRWLTDFREKASRTDAQGLYLAWFLRRQLQSSRPIVMIGYSFGARVITGSLHSLAGGSLAGRSLGGDRLTGAAITAGIIAPALESTWLAAHGYHGRATKNLQELLILYSRRDVVLKRYWLLDRIRSNVALGYTGPRQFGRRADGSQLPLRSRDCAATIGLHHRELDYYRQRQCNAGAEMARLINARFSTPGI